MKIIHFVAGLEKNNGMANTARQFIAEELAAGNDSRLTNDLKEIVRGVDIVHIHGSWLPVLWSASKAAKRIGAKLIIRPAGSYDPIRRAFHGWKKRLVAFFEHRMLRRADVLLATCEAERKWILDYEPEANVEITDLKRFFRLERECRVEVEKCRGEARTARPMHVLYLGRRHPLKGVEFLEQAVAELNKETPLSISTSSLHLRIVSDHFGEELERDWEWCDVLCLPTLSENFGRVVAEALERGKRVVVTDGAPAWEPPPEAAEVEVEVEIRGGRWWDRLSYVRGFRDGTDEERVKLLKVALEKISLV